MPWQWECYLLIKQAKAVRFICAVYVRAIQNALEVLQRSRPLEVLVRKSPSGLQPANLPQPAARPRRQPQRPALPLRRQHRERQ
eukprot:2411409-Prymnesium_polylepis.1